MAEQVWLEQRSDQDHLAWDNVVRKAGRAHAQPGLVSTLRWINSPGCLLQLQGDAVNNPQLAPRGEAGEQFAGKQQLHRSQPQQTADRRATHQTGHPTIEVRKGDLITRKGEPISPQAYDVLDFFGKSSENPTPVWLGRFLEALVACGVMLLVMRRERPGLEVRHALLALALLPLAQVLPGSNPPSVLWLCWCRPH